MAYKKKIALVCKNCGHRVRRQPDVKTYKKSCPNCNKESNSALLSSDDCLWRKPKEYHT